MGAYNLKSISLLTIIIISKQAFSAQPINIKSGVNIKDASFYLDINDIHQTQILNRRYISRSLFKGLFGYGWCSILDFKLTILNNSKYIQTCDNHTPLPFDNQTSQIYSFDSNGRLKSFKDHNENTFIVDYPKSSLIIITKNSNPHAEVFINTDNTIKKILVHSVTSASYRYKNGLLVWSKSEQNGSIEYKFNIYNNLIEWKSAFGNKEVLNYNNNWDQIISRSNNKCQETYSYEAIKNTTVALVEKKCNKKALSKTSYQFNYSRAPSGLNTLSTMLVQSGSRKVLVKYNEISGRIESIGGLNEIGIYNTAHPEF